MAVIPKLIALSEQFRGRKFELTKDLVTAGRVAERDICIEDKTISTHHCDLIKDEDDYILRDRNSTNGTRVNNKPIEEKKLQHGDIVQLGSVELLYDSDGRTTSIVAKTQTGIRVDAGEGSAAETIKRLPQNSPIITGKKNQALIFGLISVLILAVLGLIGFLVYLMFFKQQGGV